MMAFIPVSFSMMLGSCFSSRDFSYITPRDVRTAVLKLDVGLVRRRGCIILIALTVVDVYM
jgi:hypothetical protein